MLFRPRTPRLIGLAGLLLTAACSRDTSMLEPAPFPSGGTVFGDAIGAGVDFQAFSGSKTDAIAADGSTRREGTAALKVTIPNPGDPTGGYAGGAFVATVPRDLSGYNAITFWAKASIAAKLDVVGLGDDNTGTSKLTARRTNLDVTTNWKKYTLPIPLASKLKAERGMFYFAEGPENGVGYTLWFDEIKYETVDLGTPRPAIPTLSLTSEVGAVVTISGTSVAHTIGGEAQVTEVAADYFTFASSNPAVATVSASGKVTVVGTGTSTITATLGETAASGAITLRTATPPTVAAPTPTRAAADVISLFSNTYTNVPVDTWSASFDQADVADVQIGGNTTKRYTNLTFAAVEFISAKVNATAMTHLHVDVYTYDPAFFRIKLVDFGPNNVFGGGDDTEHELAITPASTPPLVANAWNSIDIPLSAFAGLTRRANLAQIILLASSPTIYLDNVYFYKTPAPPAPTAPTVAAPTPTATANNVVSLFSNAYANRTVNTWSADWDMADVADLKIANDDVKRYSNMTFAGIEFTTPPVDASAMTTMHMDLWTPDATALPALFKIKLVDFGANAAFGGGDDVEHEISVTRTTTPGFTTGAWVSLDIPFSSFTGLTTRGHLAQMILSGTLTTLYLDNVYFYRAAATANAPTVAAPTPTYTAANAVALFSNAYTSNGADTWSADWDQADVTDVKIGNDDVKRYTNVVFAGIEFISKQLNASAMTHFSMDIWTPDVTAAPASFKIKLVDFGANGAFGGGDDSEHEITLTAATMPALRTGNWVTLDIPFTAFPGLTARGHLAQLIFSGDLKTVFVDNVLVHR